jgi:protein-tyrosine phosphatase
MGSEPPLIDSAVSDPAQFDSTVSTPPCPASSVGGLRAPVTISSAPTANLRSLGGVRVRGGTIAPDLVWRSDNITLSPDGEVIALRRRGLRTVIDLRAPDEVQMTGTSVLDRNGVRHLHRPMTRKSADPATLAATFSSITDYQGVGDWYLRLARARAAVLLTCLTDIADADDGVLFYCTAGKDRTGVLAAVLLLILGAEDQDIIDDYAKTGLAADRIHLRHAAVTGRPMASTEFPNHPILDAHPDSMATFLHGVHAEGGIEAFLGAALTTTPMTSDPRDRTAAPVSELFGRLHRRLVHRT